MPRRGFAPSSSGAAGSLPDAEELGTASGADGGAESAKEDLLLRQPPEKRVCEPPVDLADRAPPCVDPDAGEPGFPMGRFATLWAE
jgi:hypothetical protein